MPEVMLLKSLFRSLPGLEEGKGWDGGWERVVAAVAEAQRDESGRKIQMTVRTLEGMLGSGEIYGRSEKIANLVHFVIELPHTSCHKFKESFSEIFLPGTMKVWIPIMKMTCMGPNL